MGLLMFPLHGGLLIVSLAIRILTICALIAALLQPAPAYVAAGKLTKVLWVIILVVGLLFSIVGVIASLVYFLDVRPAVREASGGGGPPRGSSSDGPYGPYRR